MKTHADILSQLPEEERHAITERSKELMAQEIRLRELDQWGQPTQ